MRRGLLILVFTTLLYASPALVAQRGIELHGVPASVTSPGANGRPRGIAASVTDPSFGSSLRRAGNVRHRGHDGRGRDVRPVYAVPYYGYYAGLDDSMPYDQTEQQLQQATQPQVIIVKEEPAESDDSSRYGEHSFDGREGKRQPDDDQLEQSKPASPPAAKQDDSPPTTLVYRDGHKSEVRNYAIVGSNLIDLTKSPVLKKIPLASLDLVATRKENEDNGVDFHTP